MATQQSSPITAASGGFQLTQQVESMRQNLEGRLEGVEVSVGLELPGVLQFSLLGAVLAAGTPLAKFADNAASNPGITLDNSEAVAVRWNNNGTQVAIWTAADLPIDLDPTYPATLVLLVSKSGATAADVTSFDITAFAQTVGALEDAGSNLAGTGATGTTPALTSAQAQFPAKTITRLALPIYLPPTPPARLSVSIKPTNGTLGTDDAVLNGFWLEYTRKPAVARVQIDFRAAILANGTPMAAFADNAASNPGVTLDNSKAVGLRWNNNGTQVAVWTSFELPLDMDTTKPAVLVALASKSGATVGDATTFTVTMFQQVPGALEDAGSNLGGTTSALVGNATAKNVGKVTLGIAPNTFTAAPGRVSLSIKPSDTTLGTDDAVLNGLWLEYVRKSASPILPIDLKAAILADGTPMTAFSNQATSSPGVTLDNSKAVGIRWNNVALPTLHTAIWSYVDLPLDLDTSKPVIVNVLASKSAATLADATSFDVGVFEQSSGALEDGTNNMGGTTGALNPTATAKTVQQLTYTIPGNTLPAAGPARLSVSLKPHDGTLSSDDVVCNGCWLQYTRKTG